MRIPLPLLTALALAACGPDAAALSGDLADGVEATHVWVLGQPARASFSEDSFRLEGLAHDVLDLRFSDEGEEVARMEIRGLSGEAVHLRGIWFDDGLAHPTAVETAGADVLIVNGIRMADADRVPERVDAGAMVLSVSGGGDALFVRPAGEGDPDLRVVITPGTRIRTPDGDPAAADGLEFGDSVRIVGQSEAGYVVAMELVVPRERARN